MTFFDENSMTNLLDMLDEGEKTESWTELKELETPMMQQFVNFKEEHKGHIVFFQLGEFFETYANDAELVSAKLNAKLTSKTISNKVIPMCGFPVKSGVNQANQLAKMGYKVAIIGQKKNEQDEVERSLSQIITPSSITDGDYLVKDEHQYLMVAYQMKNELGVTIVDTLSGETLTRADVSSEDVEMNMKNRFAIFDLISRYQPKEVKIYLTKEWESELMHRLKNIPCVSLYKVPYFYEEIKPIVEKHKKEYFKDKKVPYAIIVSHYLMVQTLKKNASMGITLRPIHYIEERDYLYLHQAAIQGLELFENGINRKKDKTLFDLLDKTQTPKGSRSVKKWIQEPSLDSAEIQRRYVLVDYFNKNVEARQKLQFILSQTTDIERTLGRFEKIQFKDHELISFLETLEHFHTFLKELEETSTIGAITQSAKKRKDVLTNMLEQFSAKISKEKVVQTGYSSRFDELREIKEKGLDYIQAYFEEQKEKTGIKTMKLEQEKNLGYFFEVTKSQYDKVPDYFNERKELANKKKFVTEDLEKMKLAYAEAVEEYDGMYRLLLRQISGEILLFQSQLRNIIDYIAYLDVLMGFSEVATMYHYHKPMLNEEGHFYVQQAKHPLLQAFSYQRVVPNDCKLLNEEIQIVTGPNMGGKSTYLKTIALLTIMAQIGSFVPAKFSFKPVDRILIRMGANDALLNHQSTFMVEMEEVGYIIYHATPNSLIFMDELGRGTSTSDGISLAHTIIGYLHDKIKAKTICSTHYHELISLEKDYQRVTNYHAEAKETEEGVSLTFKIIPGGSPKSFGIEVAKRVGLPKEIIEQASHLLQTKYEK